MNTPPAAGIAHVSGTRAGLIERTMDEVRSDCQWVIRCARRISELSTRIPFNDALDVAEALSFDDGLRALAPERVAEDMAGNRLHFS